MIFSMATLNVPRSRRRQTCKGPLFLSDSGQHLNAQTEILNTKSFENLLSNSPCSTQTWRR